MTDDNQKEIWKKEAKQLKEDLNSRKKTVKKRQVSIKFGKNTKKPNSDSTPKSQSLGSDTTSDDIRRQQLGI